MTHDSVSPLAPPPDSAAHPINSRATRDAPNRWGAVWLAATATFIVVSAEMMPVGLLTPIGATLGVTEGTVGLSLTITGVVAALTAPLIPAVTGGRDRKTVLVSLMVIVALANALTALSPSFAVLAGARVLLGVGMGGVWALAASLAPRLVRERSVGIAVSIVFSGIAVASVLGVPGGAYLGAALSWNTAFWGLAGAAGVTAFALAVVMPSLPATSASQAIGVPGALRIPGVRAGLTITLLLVTAHFAAYTYVRPTLEDFAWFTPTLLSGLLLSYGILGVLGTFVAGPLAARAAKPVVFVLSTGIAMVLALIPTSSAASSVVAAAVLLALWGFFYGGVSVSTQNWIAQAAPAQREAVSALWVSVFNASIALGSLTGGVLLDLAGSPTVFWVSAGVAGCAALLASVWVPTPRRQ